MNVITIYPTTRLSIPNLHPMNIHILRFAWIVSVLLMENVTVHILVSSLWMRLMFLLMMGLIYAIRNLLILQRLKLVGFLYTLTSLYTYFIPYIRLVSFYKTFTTKGTCVPINDSFRLVSKPFFCFNLNSFIILNLSYFNYFCILNAYATYILSLT